MWFHTEQAYEHKRMEKELEVAQKAHSAAQGFPSTTLPEIWMYSAVPLLDLQQNITWRTIVKNWIKVVL